jgi:hypothetical protein
MANAMVRQTLVQMGSTGKESALRVLFCLHVSFSGCFATFPTVDLHMVKNDLAVKAGHPPFAFFAKNANGG